jgi:hypothetical protein
MSYYVYSYLREDLTPYYIGKGKDGRAWNHFKGEIMPPADRARIRILACHLSEFEAHLLEIKLIALYGRKDLGTGILRNKTDGGEGSSGRVMSEESKELSRLSNLEAYSKDEVRKRHASSMESVWSSEERNSKISNSLRGGKNPMFGKTSPMKGKIHSEESKARMKAASEKRWADYYAKKKAAELRLPSIQN